MMNKFSKYTAIASLLVGLASGSAQAGKIFVSGQDSDDSGHVSTSFGGQMLDFIGAGNTNGGSGILILGGYTGTSSTSINAWNGVANSGSGYTLTHASGAAAITAIDLSSYAAVFMGSDSVNTGGGITQTELNAINTRAADIATFVNDGGNLMALTQAGLSGAFGWFPLGALTTSPISTANISQTANLAAAGFTATNAEISGDLFHNDFIGPAGFFGLDVLAVDNATGNAVILGGGVETRIVTVPAPGMVAILAFGVAGLAIGRRRKVI